jgi:hypothetical protein
MLKKHCGFIVFSLKNLSKMNVLRVVDAKSLIKLVKQCNKLHF